MFTEGPPNGNLSDTDGGTLMLEAPSNVNFDATRSIAGDVDIDTYGWAVDDDPFDTGLTTTTYFDEPGEYTVWLTVTDVDGGKSEASGNISVAATEDPGPGPDSGGWGEPGCWDVFLVWFDEEHNVLESDYLFTYCCDDVGNCLLT